MKKKSELTNLEIIRTSGKSVILNGVRAWINPLNKVVLAGNIKKNKKWNTVFISVAKYDSGLRKILKA